LRRQATGTTTHTYDSGGNLATATDARGAVAACVYKVCFGGAIGGSVSGGVVQGMDGKQCRSDRYEGWFYELGGSVGPLSGGLTMDSIRSEAMGPVGMRRTVTVRVSASYR
jgi:hypothetical protein